jgi:hypothetical protein
MKSLLALLLAFAAVPAIPKPPAAPPTDREAILAAAGREIGVVEATGRNDGEVDKYLRAVGLGGSRAPYCAAFVHWVGAQALGTRNPYPRSAWSPDMVKGGERVTSSTVIRGGETFGIWFNTKKRVAHTGLVERRDGANLVTIEANTSAAAASGSAADRDGEGVHRKRRHWRTVYFVRDWAKGGGK